MASFDIIECTSQSYKFMWEYRAYVVRLSFYVILLKILGFTTFILLGMDDNYLRQGIFLLPVFFLEGWAIAQLVLMALQVEHKPKVVPGVNEAAAQKSILPAPQDIIRFTKASAIIYTLTKLAMAFVIGMAMHGYDPDAPNQTPASEASGPAFIFVLLLIGMMIWTFRFFWLYIPIIFGKTPLDYLLRFRAFSSSFYLLGVWLLCFVPAAILMLFMTEILAGSLTLLSLQDNDTAFQIGIAVVQAFVDYLLALLSSLAIGFGIFSVFNDENKKTEIW